ncbi:MAG: hypothetical protein RJB39_712 [Candidatus Parcubacteria bacterium]|jgi:alpha-tubulin suppressor-like RCC1 family protein
MKKNSVVYTVVIAVVFVIIILINIRSLKSSPVENNQISEALASTSLARISTATSSTATSTATSTLPGKTYSYSFFGIGKNDHGQFGPGVSSVTNRRSYTLKLPYEVKKLYAGKGHMMAITKADEVISWGQNDVGQLGYTTKESFTTNAKKIDGLSDIISLASTNNHSLALTAKGEVFAWGQNYTGQLGDGTRQNRATPELVKGLPAISKIAAGHKFSLALTASGEVYAWGASCDTSAYNRGKALLAKMGSNIIGLQGGYYDNTSNSGTPYDLDQDCINEEQIKIKSPTPIKLPTSGISQISVGYGHALMLRNDGKVIAFGCNLYGQLGNEPGAKKGQWMRTVDGLENIKAVAAGARHSLFLDTGGNVYAAGANFKGQLADHSSVNHGKVAKVAGLPPIKSIYAGFDYSVAVATDGTVWGWGINDENFLVDNLPSTLDFPIQIRDKAVSQVITGGMFIVFR